MAGIHTIEGYTYYYKGTRIHCRDTQLLLGIIIYALLILTIIIIRPQLLIIRISLTTMNEK
jgi:hypothetical protein